MHESQPNRASRIQLHATKGCSESAHGPRAAANRSPRVRQLACACVGLAAWMTAQDGPAYAKDVIWRQEGAAALSKGQRDGVVISDDGAIRLGPRLTALPALDCNRVWDLARSVDGTLFAASGDQGRIYRFRPPGDWQLIHDAGNTLTLCLDLDGTGRIAVGTGPEGRVLEMNGDGSNVTSSWPHPSVKYVWKVRYAADGSLYAATGPQGQLWKKSSGAAGAWSLIFDAPQPHLLSLALAPDGSVYAGSDAGALIYRIPAGGDAEVVLDAPQDEVRVLLHVDGVLYAGTASEPPSSPARAAAWLRPGLAGNRVLRASTRAGRPGPGSLGDDADAPGGTARLRPGAAGENVVYRIEAGDAPREIFRVKALIHALAVEGDRVLVGTGPDGQLYELTDHARRVTPLARIPHAQILTMLSGPEKSTWLGTSDPGAVYKLSAGCFDSGTFVSEVLDTSLPSRFGALRFEGEEPPGTRVVVHARTGSIAEPDATWSDWSEAGQPLDPARFVQYRLTLTTRDPSQSPTVTCVELAYRTLNLPPEITSLNVPDLTSLDGSTRRTKVDMKWEASDPNDDDLTYELSIRKDDWPHWLPLNRHVPIVDKTWSLDTTTLPTGRYRLRLVARDDRSNPPAEALASTRTSTPFWIDHLPPAVELEMLAATNGALRIRARVSDRLTRIARVEYCLDGGPWTPAFPDDGLFDSLQEDVSLLFEGLSPGTHVLVLKATDAAGNPGASDLVFTAQGTAQRSEKVNTRMDSRKETGKSR